MRPPLVLTLSLLAAACGSPFAASEDGPLEQDLGATVHVALTADANGHHYRLRGTSVELTGAALATLREPRGLEQESLSMPLPPGEYSSYLRPGYHVMEVLPDGKERPVPAVLAEPNPSQLRVLPQQDVALPLAFQVEGQRVVFSRRPLRLSMAASQAGSNAAVLAER